MPSRPTGFLRGEISGRPQTSGGFVWLGVLNLFHPNGVRKWRGYKQTSAIKMPADAQSQRQVARQGHARAGNGQFSPKPEKMQTAAMRLALRHRGRGA